LAEFACDHIGDEDNRNLEEVSSADARPESLILNRLNHLALSSLVLQRICRSHDYRRTLTIYDDTLYSQGNDTASLPEIAQKVCWLTIVRRGETGAKGREK
jgi:hypothetical protein